MEARFSGRSRRTAAGDTSGLLRVLQEREFERVGGTSSPWTSEWLPRPIRFERSRGFGQVPPDFVLQTECVPIQIPPLRERVADISLLGVPDRPYGKKREKIPNIARNPNYSKIMTGGQRSRIQNVIERRVILCVGTPFLWMKLG